MLLYDLKVRYTATLRNCVKAEVDVLGSPSQEVRTVPL